MKRKIYWVYCYVSNWPIEWFINENDAWYYWETMQARGWNHLTVLPDEEAAKRMEKANLL